MGEDATSNGREGLRSLAVFAGLDDAELAEIEGRADEIDLDPGQVLIREGWAGHQAFVILDGQAAVTAHGRHIATVGTGQVVGDAALVGTDARTVTVTALTPMRLLVLERAHFDSPPAVGTLAAKLLSALTARGPEAERRRPSSGTTAADFSTASHDQVMRSASYLKGRKAHRCRYCLERFQASPSGYCLYSPTARHDLDDGA